MQHNTETSSSNIYGTIKSTDMEQDGLVSVNVLNTNSTKSTASSSSNTATAIASTASASSSSSTFSSLPSDNSQRRLKRGRTPSPANQSSAHPLKRSRPVDTSTSNSKSNTKTNNKSNNYSETETDTELPTDNNTRPHSNQQQLESIARLKNEQFTANLARRLESKEVLTYPAVHRLPGSLITVDHAQLMEHIIVSKSQRHILTEMLSTSLRRLMDHPKNQGMFNEPVNLHLFQNYVAIIEKPMDLGTVRANVVGGQYMLLSEYHRDVHLVFSNAMLYNSNTHHVHKTATF